MISSSSKGAYSPGFPFWSFALPQYTPSGPAVKPEFRTNRTKISQPNAQGAARSRCQAAGMESSGVDGVERGVDRSPCYAHKGNMGSRRQARRADSIPGSLSFLWFDLGGLRILTAPEAA